MAGPEETADALARNLRRLRAGRGLTLDELAKRAAISRSMLIQVEQQRVNPTLAVLVRLTRQRDRDEIDEALQCHSPPPPRPRRPSSSGRCMSSASSRL